VGYERRLCRPGAQIIVIVLQLSESTPLPFRRSGVEILSSEVTKTKRPPGLLQAACARSRG